MDMGNDTGCDLSSMMHMRKVDTCDIININVHLLIFKDVFPF